MIAVRSMTGVPGTVDMLWLSGWRLTAQAGNVIPSMNVRWASKKMTAIGIKMTAAAAINPGQLTTCRPKKLKSPTCKVYFSGEER